MKIGHAHLKVRQLDRSVSFYHRYLNLQERERVGEAFSFLSGTGMHHELALQELGVGASSPSAGSVGLYHVAFEVESKQELKELYQKLTADLVPHVLVDHRISVACYFSDPDDHGVEVYLDTRHEMHNPELWQGRDRPIDAADYFAS